MKHILSLHLILLLSLPGLALSPLAQAASSYKWTDSKGDVHYSQHPPRNKSYEKIKTPKHRPARSPAPQQAPASAASSPSSSNESDTNGSDVLKREQASNAEIRKKNCEQSKKNLQAYSVFRRIRDPDGTIRNITDKERAEQKKKAEDGIRDFCS